MFANFRKMGDAICLAMSKWIGIVSEALQKRNFIPEAIAVLSYIWPVDEKVIGIVSIRVSLRILKRSSRLETLSCCLQNSRFAIAQPGIWMCSLRRWPITGSSHKKYVCLLIESWERIIKNRVWQVQTDLRVNDYCRNREIKCNNFLIFLLEIWWLFHLVRGRLQKETSDALCRMDGGL